MSSGGASDLAAALGAAVAERLSARGWRPVERQLRPPGHIGEFSLPLADGFVALGEFDWVGPYRVLTPEFRLGVPEDAEVRQLIPDTSTLELTVSVGVCFEPLLELLDAIDGSGIRDIVSERLEDLEVPPAAAVVTVGSMAEVPQAADRLAGLVFDHALPFAERHASVDALLAALGNGDWVDPDGVDHAERLRAGLLVAAGRFDEARKAVAEMEAEGEEGMDWRSVRERRRLIRQLRRWIDAEGDLQMPVTRASWPAPAALPPPPFTGPPDLKELFDKGRAQARIFREAFEAVRARDTGQDRDGLTAIVEEEWSRRELRVDPVQVALQVDKIIAEREPLGKARLLLGAIGPAVDALRALAKDRGIAGVAEHKRELPPEWLRPPERAAYPVGFAAGRKVAVKLDQTAADFIARIAEHGRGEGPSHEVEAWFEWQADSDATSLTVHIGPQRVGMLPGEAVEAYRPVMAAAAERDELPYAKGTIARLLGEVPYMLTVTLPVLS